MPEGIGKSNKGDLQFARVILFPIKAGDWVICQKMSSQYVFLKAE